MSFEIVIFNQLHLDAVDEEALLGAVSRSNFRTLCEQYGLDPALSAPAMSYLEVLKTSDGIASFFLLKYLAEGHRPIVIYQWDCQAKEGARILSHARQGCESDRVRQCLDVTKTIFLISLSKSQLEDIGLLLAYEVARWLAEQGRGILRDVHGDWYRLNQHTAFLPVQ